MVINFTDKKNKEVSEASIRTYLPIIEIWTQAFH